MMGLDWDRATWWDYTSIRWEWNERHSDEKAPADLSRLERVMAAHTVQ